MIISIAIIIIIIIMLVFLTMEIGKYAIPMSYNCNRRALTSMVQRWSIWAFWMPVLIIYDYIF